MDAPHTSSRGRDLRAFELTFLCLGAVGFMYFAAEVLKPLALSVLLSFALAPAARRLELFGLPRGIASGVTVFLALVLMGGVGYVVGGQLVALAEKLPEYRANILQKLGGVYSSDKMATQKRLQDLVDEVTNKLETSSQGGEPEADSGEDSAFKPIPKVQVVTSPSVQDRLRSSSGPYLEFLGVSSFVLVLVLFMLVEREELSDRIVGLIGTRHVSLTTKTMEEIGDRISRYLGTFAIVNSCFGLVVGLGLAAIHLPFAVLWGCLAGMMRFIPYVGPAVGFSLPFIFSIAYFPGWWQPLAVVALFGVIELLLNSFLEPVIYGKTTGVSALALLVAAMFWTWLWGTLGLLLSTPLTVCLVVLGKYVPSLSFLATLMSDETELSPDVRLYQRLVALDREGVDELIEAESKQLPRVEMFDKVLLPALRRAEHDRAREDIDEVEHAFVLQVVSDHLDELESREEVPIEAATTLAANPEGGEAPAGEPVAILGLAAHDACDRLVLRMLGQILPDSAVTFEVLADAESPLEMAEKVVDAAPRMVVVSHVPPEGLSVSRYIVRRLRARLDGLDVLVGLWGDPQAVKTASQSFLDLGASGVASTLAEARELILKKTTASAGRESLAAPLPG